MTNNPALLIEGEAGIGKSHLLADIVSKRTIEGKGSLLLLGQHFVTEEDPWHQISNKLHLKCSPQEFLGSLNAKAEITGSRFLLFIDAINEGKGRYFWNDNLKSFIHLVSQYQWLGLVLSIRSSYVNLIAPSNEILEEDILRYRHLGFVDIEYEASKIFFANYGIDFPSVPLLHPEFQNPLFLKLFCEGLNKSGLTRIPDGLQGISSIINFFIESSNEKLHKPSYLDYPRHINVIKKAIDALMAEKLECNLRYIEYERAYIICEDILKKYSSKRHLVDELISEGVLSKNCFFVKESKYEEGIYLTYERFEDHAMVAHLLDGVVDLDISFTEGGNLFVFVKDENACYEHRGIIDALSIQLPEKYSRELYEFVSHKDYGEYTIAESFVHSLLWRKLDTMHDGLKDYINKVVFAYSDTYDQFLDTMIAVSVLPNHKFNAIALHNFLFDVPMPDRDSWWSFSYLRGQMDSSSSVKRLVDWSWKIEDRAYISDDSISLASIALAWFLCSPDRVLRDSSTKALVSLMQHRLPLVIKLLQKFEGVNDPHIYERLYAVAFGASVRASNTEGLLELSEYIFEKIFKDKEKVYPHILLRDYARGVIEYANYKKLLLTFDITIARPPYRSQLPGKAFSNEELDKRYKIDYDDKDYKKYHRGQNLILHSMTTEYGRGGGYGDFGRYTFQSALSAWKVDYDILSNKAVEWIFEKYGYDVEKHGALDTNVPYNGRKAKGQERIGKKYQWLAFYEILALVADNIDDFNEKSHWTKYEEKGNYKGPWEPYVRDIDPTLLIKNTGYVNEDDPVNFWWANNDPIETELNDDEWIANKNDIPEANGIISVVDDGGVDWLILEGYPEWAEKRQLGEEKFNVPHKRMWWQIRSYLVKDKDYDSFIKWTERQNFWGRWMPESRDRYEMFNREYYWSPAYNFFQQEYYSGELWRKVYKRQKNEKDEFKVMVSTDSYMWEEEFDFSKETTIRIVKPGQHIFENMDMHYSKKDGIMIDSKGQDICFDTSIYNDSKQFLLIRKKEFLKYLKDNGLNIVWTMIGEKQIIGGSLGRSHNREHNFMELSGSFRYEDDIIIGNIKTELK